LKLKLFKLLALTVFFIIFSGCASILLAPVTVAGAAAEYKTGKSPMSSFLSKVTGDDCDLKRILKANYPCRSETNEVEKNIHEIKKEKL
jgi:ABC-type Zn uptake system ZnuABC Zn-binding protein ZnuA